MLLLLSYKQDVAARGMPVGRPAVFAGKKGIAGCERAFPGAIGVEKVNAVVFVGARFVVDQLVGRVVPADAIAGGEKPGNARGHVDGSCRGISPQSAGGDEEDDRRETGTRLGKMELHSSIACKEI
jgi:hypothetical protein